MSNQHAERALTVRTPEAVRSQSEEILAARHLQMRGFVVACLTALAADPDTFLAGIAEHWPPPKSPGRPPQN